MTPPIAATVEVNLFSGLRNPRWTLPAPQADRFRAAVSQFPIDQIVAPRDENGELLWRPITGYRGLEVSFAGAKPQGAEQVSIYDRHVFEAATGRFRKDIGATSLEEQIYAQMPIEIRKQLGGLTLPKIKEVGHESLIRNLQGPHVLLPCESAPAFLGNVAPWSTHRFINNCYNYATAVANIDKTKDPAIPGPGNLTQDTIPDLKRALKADLLVDTGLQLPNQCPPPGSHYLAVLLRKHPTGVVKDFHCLRLDRNGAWSHKDGKGTVRKRDDAGGLMTDLTKVALSWEPELVGIYIMFDANAAKID